jgi:hypothetical protein
MSKMFIGRFVASILTLLIASSGLRAHGQSQSALISDEDEAAILETLLRLEIKTLGSEIGNIRAFSSDNLSKVSARRIEKLGFYVIAPSNIEKGKSDHVVEYVVVRSIHLRRGIVVVKLSAVTEGRPCFAPAFSRERSFTYEFQKSLTEWVGRLVKRSAPFPFSRSLR